MGSSFFFVELALEGGFGPLTIVAARTIVAAVALIIVRLARRRGLAFLWRQKGQFAIAGLFNCVLPFTFFAWGQQYIDSSVAALMTSATPLASLVFAVAVRDERFALTTLIALGLGIAGVAVLAGPTFGLGALVLLGTLAAFAAAISYAVGSVHMHKFMRSRDSFETAVGAITYAAVMSLPLAFVFEQPLNFDFQLWPMVALVELGVVGTGLAFLVFFRLVYKYGSTNASLVDFMVPISAFILGFFVLGERLGPEFYIGGAAILLAILVLDGRLLPLRMRNTL